MPRPVLEESRIHPAIRRRIGERHADLIREVESALAVNDIVVVGMAMNPHPRRARKALDASGVPYKYLEYGSYLGEWRRRNALKMWTGWPTLPMVFVKGALVGGADEVQQLIATGELKKMIEHGEGHAGGLVQGRVEDRKEDRVEHRIEDRADGRVHQEGMGSGSKESEVALAFLAAMERRDLEAARKFLAPGFSMCFPGGAEMRDLEVLVERSRGRYRSVAKNFDRVDECRTGDAVVVYCSGRLHGTWRDGREFDGIRFIDRFEVVDGLIRRQDVWNDMGELVRR